MTYIRCFNLKTHGFLFKINSTSTSLNYNMLLGILILTVVLLAILIVLILKSLNKIKILYDKSDDKAKKGHSILDDPLADTIENINESMPSSTIGSNIDKVSLINDELNTFGFAYDLDNEDFYSIMYPWQRQFGYCKIYDEAAPALSIIVDCEPIYFEYNGKHWLIEFWKGQYGITSGAEIGIYNTKSDALNIPGVFLGTFYQAVDDSERLHMSFSLLKNNKLISERKGLHWWLSSFVLGDFSQPHELTMYIEINFPNIAMADAFIKGLNNAGYTRDSFSVQNNTVYIIFDEPYTDQPYTSNEFTQNLMQESNKRNVEAFNKVTHNFTNIIDKLYFLRQETPDYYEDILKLGRPKELYRVYDIIQMYLD